MKKHLTLLALLSLLLPASLSAQQVGENSDQKSAATINETLARLCENTARPLAPSLDGDIPLDVNGPNQASFNCFAWQLFIALNRPLAGFPPPANMPTDTDDSDGEEPVVWEGYQSIYDIFQTDETPLPTWTGYQADRKLKDGRDTKQVDGSPLFDWNQKKVYDEIRINREGFDYIVRKRLHSPVQTSPFCSPKRHFFGQNHLNGDSPTSIISRLPFGIWAPRLVNFRHRCSCANLRLLCCKYSSRTTIS